MIHVRRHVTAKELGTLVLILSCYDEERKLRIPKSLSWTLLFPDKTIVNNREEVEVDTAYSMKLVIFGNDLKIFPEYTNSRVLLLKGVYESDLGLDLPIYETVIIDIENLFSLG